MILEKGRKNAKIRQTPTGRACLANPDVFAAAHCVIYLPFLGSAAGVKSGLE